MSESWMSPGEVDTVYARICAIASMDVDQEIARWLEGTCDLLICCNEDMNAGDEESKSDALNRFVEAHDTDLPDDRRVWIRINQVGSRLWRREIFELWKAGYRQFVIPKVESAEDILRTEAEVSAIDGDASDLRLLLMIETPEGVVKLSETLDSSENIAGVVFGREDFRSSTRVPLGATSYTGVVDLHGPGSMIVNRAAHFGIAAIDGASDVGEPYDHMVEDARFSAAMGFTGKLCVSKLAARSVWEGFAPSDASQALAASLVDGTSGDTVTEPMRRRAELTLSLGDWARGYDPVFSEVPGD